jgi:hypothetical protein
VIRCRMPEPPRKGDDTTAKEFTSLAVSVQKIPCVTICPVHGATTTTRFREDTWNHLCKNNLDLEYHVE